MALQWVADFAGSAGSAVGASIIRARPPALYFTVLELSQGGSAVGASIIRARSPASYFTTAELSQSGSAGDVSVHT